MGARAFMAAESYDRTEGLSNLLDSSKIHAMDAAILAVGSELLGTDRLDTNSLLLTRTLGAFGVELQRKVVTGDDVEAIVQEVGRLSRVVDLLLITGGLGPTADDLTREGVARALERRLIADDEMLDDIRRKFERFGMSMPEVNRRQAELIEGASWLINSRGTAPGMQIDTDDCVLFLFPGVPTELERMIESSLIPWLEEHSEGLQTETGIVRVACLSESTVEERIQPAYEEFGRERISVLASPADIQVRVLVTGRAEERARELEAMTDRIAGLVGRAAYSRDADGTLESVVGELLSAAGKKVATAESCTGGLVAERLTRVPGSSEFFEGATVTYSNRLKRELLGVKADTLDRHGAVSREVVEQMAVGVVARLNSDLGVAISGVAGPSGGTAAKPVGTVHVAVAEAGSEDVDHQELHLPGDRRRVRRLASQWALEMLRGRLLR
ncbi:MAG: competence/damage-inducible protein A [Acidobacteria bacterium]|nr:MAG: competence/damage-inducible protein A [Acidobacteriota bacterium]